jgi:large subunit ribosomal protein L25
MSNETPTLEAHVRDRLGSRYAKRLRATGRMPAVIYGHGETPLAVSLDAKETLQHLHHGTHVFRVVTDRGEETCLVKDLQFGHLGDDVIHIDLTRVNLDEEVEVLVHLEFAGAPAAAAKAGVVLTHVLNEIEVRCQVRDIPEMIRVDLEKMAGDALTVGDLALPAGCVAKTAAEAMVAHLEHVGETAEGEAVEADAATSPEVLTGRKEEGETS